MLTQFSKKAFVITATAMSLMAMSHMGVAQDTPTKEKHIFKVYGEDKDVKVIQLEMDNLDELGLEAQLAPLDEKAQKQVKAALSKLALLDKSQAFVISQELDGALGDASSQDKTKVIVLNSEFTDLPSLPSVPVSPEVPDLKDLEKTIELAEELKVVYLKENDALAQMHKFEALKSLLQSSSLTPEQIDEIQTLLNTK